MARLTLILALLTLAVAIAAEKPAIADEASAQLGTGWFQRTVITTGVAALIAAVFGFLRNLRLQLLQHRRQRESLFAAIISEMCVLIDMVERSGYVNIAKQHADSFANDPSGPMPRLLDPRHSELIHSEFFYPVFYGSIGRLGILGHKTAGKVVRFYSLCRTNTADFVAYASGQWDNRESNEKEKALRDNIKAWKDAKAIAHELKATFREELKKKGDA